MRSFRMSGKRSVWTLPLGLLAAIMVMTPSPSFAASGSTVMNLPEGMSASYLVFDRINGQATVGYDIHRQYRSASLVKVLIALDNLRSHGTDSTIPDADRALLEPMLRASDDSAAGTLWNRDGQRAIVERMIATIGLVDSAPPPVDMPRWWGYTAISAADMVKIYQYIEVFSLK